MVISIQKPKKIRNTKPKLSQEAMLKALVYEEIDGRPLYYKGYRDVLISKKNQEDIMGASTIQWILVSYFMEFMILSLDKKKYRFATGEAGLHIGHRSNFANDIAIFEKSVLTPQKINTRYADVAPKIVVEIDIKIDLELPEDKDYVNLKTQKLLDFGVQTVFWIFTASQKIMVAHQNQDWTISTWYKDIELLDGQFFNIGQYLDSEGIVL